MVVRNVDVCVYKYEKHKFDQLFLSSKPKHLFLGKWKVCEITEFSKAKDNPFNDGNTSLPELENDEDECVSGYEFFKFKTDDKIIIYISLIGNNLCLYIIKLEKNHIFHRQPLQLYWKR